MRTSGVRLLFEKIFHNDENDYSDKMIKDENNTSYFAFSFEQSTLVKL